MRSSWLICAMAAVALQLPGFERARSEASVTIGHVAEIRGNWRLFPSGTEETDGEPLYQYAPLKARGVLRLKSPQANDAITVVDADLKVIATRSCKIVTSCYQPIFLPDAPREATLMTEASSALGSVWDLLWHETHRQSVHRVRLPNRRMSEDVVAIANGEVDLKHVMAPLRDGRYVLKRQAPPSAATAGGEEIEFDWSPAERTTVEIGTHPPGLYEITPAATPERLYQSGGPSLYVLLCDPAQCPELSASFERSRSAVADWRPHVSEPTVHQFLRAVLVELAAPRRP